MAFCNLRLPEKPAKCYNTDLIIICYRGYIIKEIKYSIFTKIIKLGFAIHAISWKYANVTFCVQSLLPLFVVPADACNSVICCRHLSMSPTMPWPYCWSVDLMGQDKGKNNSQNSRSVHNYGPSWLPTLTRHNHVFTMQQFYEYISFDWQTTVY